MQVGAVGVIAALRSMYRQSARFVVQSKVYGRSVFVVSPDVYSTDALTLNVNRAGAYVVEITTIIRIMCASLVPVWIARQCRNTNGLCVSWYTVNLANTEVCGNMRVKCGRRN